LLTKKVLIAAICVSSLLALVYAIPSSAQSQNTIVSGKSTAYNINTAGEPPQKWYTSSPLLMVSAKVGSGAVVAAGIASTCRDNRWNNPNNPDNNLDVLLDKAFQWMKPGAKKVLWYEGYGVYNTISTNPVQCANLRDALEAKGYTLTGDTTAPITLSYLSSYDILVIPQLELGDSGTGGNPNLLPDADVQAIKSFVEGGNGLLIMDQSDYAGHNYSNVQNKILIALGVGFYLQDDQAEDSTNKWGGSAYQPIANVGTTAFGSDYQSATGKSEIGLYDICSLRIEENYDVSLFVSPTVGTGKAGDVLTYAATVTNIGLKGDNFNITVRDLDNWPLSLSKTQVSLENGENAEVDVRVTVPSNLTIKMVDNVTVSVLAVSGGENMSVSVRAINVFPRAAPIYPIVNPGITHFLGPGLPDLTVDLPAVPIITCIASGYSYDIVGRAPWPVLYGKGEFPPLAAAALVGNGRVVATNNALLRDKYFDQTVLSNEQVMSDIARWMENWGDPKGDKFIYFIAGTGVYHVPSIVTKWLGMLRNLGFNVSTQVGGEITSSSLENVSILNIAEILRPLSPDEIQAVTNFVNNGGGLIIMCQSDYLGYGMPDYPNAVLQALNVPIAFQDDEAYDDNSWVVDGPWYPQVYLLDTRQVNPNFDVWFPAYDFTANISNSSLTANDVQVLLPFTVTNTGTRSSSYDIKVKETSPTLLGWATNLWPTGGSVASGENIEGYVTVTVPKIEVGKKRINLVITVTDQNQTFLADNISFAILGDNNAPKITQAKFENGQKVSSPQLSGTIVNLGYTGGGVWTYVVQTGSGQVEVVPESNLSGGGAGGFPIWIIAVVIVVVVVVVAGGYFAMRKKSSPAKVQ
jgi:hypothetical protein